jgi:beta-exotoxin I transport system permease protein
MLRSVLAKTIRDARRGLVWWSLGMLGVVLLTVGFWPSVRDSPELERFARNAPDVLKAFTGGELDFATPIGYLEARLFALIVPVLFLIYAIGAGARAIAGEEEAGTLDLLLSLPLSRGRLVLEKAAALGLQLGALALVLLAFVVAAAAVVSMDVSAARIGAAVVTAYLLAVAHGALALAIGAGTGKRAMALGIAASVAVAGYLLDGLAQFVDALEPWRVLSPFDWAGEPLRNGLGAGTVALAVAAVAGAAAAFPLFARRDVAVG